MRCTRPHAPRRHSRLAAVLSGLAVLLPGLAGAQDFSDPGFAAETVVALAPFDPVGITWSHDGRMFIWQKDGLVRVYHDGVLQPTPFLDLRGRVNTAGDRGLLGLVVDPNFEANGYVYLAYVYEAGGNPNDEGPKISRLTRVTADPANPDVALPGSESILIDAIPADGTSHTAGTLRFAADGTLFLSNGDGAPWQFTNPLALGAQDVDSLRGKLLRINADGSAPAPPLQTNPLWDGTDSVRSKVWAYGFRNPFRFDLHPVLGDPYVGDVGQATWEEVDRAVPAGNYGWPCYEGPAPESDYQATFPTECGAVQPSDLIPPLYTYDHSVGSAVVGGAFYTGDAYPQAYRNNFFFSDYVGGWVRRLVLDPNGGIAQNLPFADGIVAVSMAVGPDGLLYYVDFVSGEIRRILFGGPVAAASATPSSGYSPLSVTFSSAGSFDALGSPLTYFWDFGDGGTSTAANPTHTYVIGAVHRFDAGLTVSNASSQTSFAPVSVTVGSLPPSPTILAPSNGNCDANGDRVVGLPDFAILARNFGKGGFAPFTNGDCNGDGLVGFPDFQILGMEFGQQVGPPGSTAGVLPGQTVSYEGTASDPDEILPDSALSWTILLHHNTHVHTFIGGSGTTGSFVAEYHGVGTYSYELILTATDSSGLQASTSVKVPVLPDTSPPSDPANLASQGAGSTSIDLGWSASTDDAAVSSYRIERCAGAGCSDFAEIGATAGTTFSDVGLAPGTTYSYRVRASDPTGNLSGYSNTLSAQTAGGPPPPRPGLVAAYSFDEGSGSTVGDLSGNGNDGSISGAAWTSSGRYGRALVFDGTAAVVVVPDSSSLDLVGGMTLEAWVNPTSPLSGWKAILQKEVDAWFLNANTGGDRAGTGGTFSGVCCTVTQGPSALVPNQWTHVAGTWDGATLRLYLNGAEVASQAQAGSLEVNGAPLRIGGNTYATEFFPGRIDEVRIYNRALSESEIQSDMVTPVGGASVDAGSP